MRDGGGILKLALGRIASILLVSGGWLLIGVRVVLDLIGYSTLPEDVVVAHERANAALVWISGIPWWALLGFALITTLWLMHVSWPRSMIGTASPQPNPDEHQTSEQDRLVVLGNRCLTLAEDLEMTTIPQEKWVQVGSFMRVLERNGIDRVRISGDPTPEEVENIIHFLKVVGQNLIDENFDDTRFLAAQLARLMGPNQGAGL